jgi:hypothetical protein
MRTITASDATKAVVRRNTEEVQSGGNFGVFEELFASRRCGSRIADFGTVGRSVEQPWN